MQDHFGFTALGITCQHGHVHVARLLIERGAAIDYQNKVRLLLQCSMCIITVALSDTLIGIGIEEPHLLPLPQPCTIMSSLSMAQHTLAILYILMSLTHLACNKQWEKAAIE